MVSFIKRLICQTNILVGFVVVDVKSSMQRIAYWLRQNTPAHYRPSVAGQNLEICSENCNRVAPNTSDISLPLWGYIQSLWISAVVQSTYLWHTSFIRRPLKHGSIIVDIRYSHYHRYGPSLLRGFHLTHQLRNKSLITDQISLTVH